MQRFGFVRAYVAVIAMAGTAWADPSPWKVSVDPSVDIGKIKPMNAVNGGPVKFKSNSRSWRQARIPFGRTHDMNHSWEFGGPHTIDVDAVFPNFDADENDPKNYDFTNTDLILDAMQECGTEPLYRLGPSIESGVKKYHVHPPKDFAKWARICEHIILHCNKGWANGRARGIRYWEIWFEPDLGDRAWTGTKEQFLDLFKVAAKHLKQKFPELKIGGPGMASWLGWKEDFIPFCQKEKVPLDFYSWHCYTSDVHKIGRRAQEVRAWLDDHGFKGTESVFDEWNYVVNWDGGEWAYTRQVESGCHIQKGAAFAAAVMSMCQDSPIEIAMYYDARVFGGMNMLFNSIDFREMKGYYPFYAWGKILNDYGSQVKASVDAPKEKASPSGQLFATAARNARGELAVLVTRYVNDNNVLDWRDVKVCLPPEFAERRMTCHLTDDVHVYTEITVDKSSDGSVILRLIPNSFAFLEFVK